MQPKKVQAIFSRWHAHNPHPTTELIYHSPFELLISVLLSAQTTDKAVNKATAILFALANTPESLLALGAITIKNAIKTIGLAQTKTKHILATCEVLIAKHASIVPNQREALENLPGVGRKTANVILNTIFNEFTLAVDTHIFRLSNRIGLVQANTPLKVEQGLIKIIPRKFLLHAHHWLILHGRYICTARKPKCYSCMIADLCEYPDKTT